MLGDVSMDHDTPDVLMLPVAVIFLNVYRPTIL